MKTKQYGAIDIMKILCALLIVCAHFISENATGRINRYIDYASSIYVIVVPFFFFCGGYFLFQKIIANPDAAKNNIKGYIKRIMLMYGVWSAIYILFTLLKWIRFGVSSDEVVKYIVNSLLYSTYKTIWFLPAMCIGVLMTYILGRKIGYIKTMYISFVFYLIGALGVSYSFLITSNQMLKGILDTYNYWFESARNGVFNAFPFIAMGAYMAKKNASETSEPDNKNNLIKYFILCCCFAVAFIIEAFVIKLKFNAVNANTLIMLIPFTWCFVGFGLSVRMPANNCTKWMRKMSSAIFVCQRVFLTAIPELLPGSIFATLLSSNPYLGLAYVIVITTMLSAFIVYISSKNKYLAVIC